MLRGVHFKADKPVELHIVANQNWAPSAMTGNGGFDPDK
jgi:hypothetical protein